MYTIKIRFAIHLHFQPNDTTNFQIYEINARHKLGVARWAGWTIKIRNNSFLIGGYLEPAFDFTSFLVTVLTAFRYPRSTPRVLNLSQPLGHFEWPFWVALGQSAGWHLRFYIITLSIISFLETHQSLSRAGRASNLNMNIRHPLFLSSYSEACGYV